MTTSLVQQIPHLLVKDNINALFVEIKYYSRDYAMQQIKDNLDCYIPS